MYHRFITFFTFFSLFLVNSAFAAPFKYSWDVRDLLAAKGDTVELRDDKGRLLKTLRTQQLVRIYAVMKGIEKAAEVNSMLIIVDGRAPNAFATKVQGKLLTEEEIAKKREQREKNDSAVVGTAIGGSGSERTAQDENAIEINLVGINFAMMDMLGDDMHMVAALIGHELGHIVLNHGEESKEKAPRTQVGFRTAAETRYSRDNEREADYIGAIWMVEAGFDPKGAVRLQELLYKSSKHRSGAFVGSHPSSTERIAILKSLSRRLSK